MGAKASVATYKDLTKEEFLKEVESLLLPTTDGLGSGRQVIVRTGQKGAEMFNHHMELDNALDMLDWLLEKKAVTKQEKESLTTMLKSPDWENFYLAIDIIKIRQYGAKIQR